ncbi:MULTISPECIES: hypothetical protein [Sphingobacterium]|uniref:hypothetical protein n=1 Tax=Sphingobacterium TaxID=28453 RepID=UPI00104F4A54|nr:MULTISPECIES: hypothetical protein [Sphingobacterium]MCW2262098.1 hypothetical protein [Sphingobacterium kitahiroshimense]TCR13155.1 hypothetical protein EDF67_102569 [Sphingobacterium sp. JUb78]
MLNVTLNRMLKNSKWESYALSPEEEMFSYQSKKRVPILKKPVMISLLPEGAFKKRVVVLKKEPVCNRLKDRADERPKDRYYSYVIASNKENDSYSAVVRDERKDVLRISLVNMAIYECYLFALGLPLSFPTEHIIVHGEDKSKLVPPRTNNYRQVSASNDFYDYELTVPADTEREQYSQRIMNDLNEHFQLEVHIENLSVVKDSMSFMTDKGESIELIWEKQPTMIMKTKMGAKVGKTYPMLVENN